MYPEVSCPSRLLYSIYTGRETQCNKTNNYTQSILPTSSITKQYIQKTEYYSLVVIFYMIAKTQDKSDRKNRNSHPPFAVFHTLATFNYGDSKMHGSKYETIKRIYD
jgi:hypothetical protein